MMSRLRYWWPYLLTMLFWVVLFYGCAVADGAPTRRVRAKVTGYCPCRICCGPGAKGITSTGRDARTPGCAVAPSLIPYGSRVHIPGAGWRTADDTGGAMRQSARRGVVHVDLRFRTHEEARQWGVQWLDVEVLAKRR